MPAAASFGMLAVASILFHYASILSHPHKCRPVVIACSYHGEPLEEPMAQLAVNALQYYLSQVRGGWRQLLLGLAVMLQAATAVPHSIA